MADRFRAGGFGLLGHGRKSPPPEMGGEAV
jgi:hypothetical protein